MDFVSDALSDGRRFRVLTVVDTFTREALATRADARITVDHVVRVLEGLVAKRGEPASIRVDNGGADPCETLVMTGFELGAGASQ